MTDLISRQAAINSFRYDDDGTAWDVDDIVYRLEQFPSAQPMMTNAADLINRGDAILAVYKRIKQLGMENDADVLSIRQSIRDLASAQPYTEEEIQAMQDLEQAQLDKAYQIGVEEGLRSAQPQWIPCSERLPEHDGEKYLVTLYSDRINVVSVRISYCYMNRDGFWSDVPVGYKVTAWMPLPAPWKGEQPC